MGGVGNYYIEDDGKPQIMTSLNKTEYKVPLMTEIQALKWNGFNIVSTFSGAGGSCLGYRMANYKVLWVSEFIPEAQQVYKINHPNSILDTRDIRKVQPNEILQAIGLGKGEIDILDGSPPCSSFSTAGKRSKGWGTVKKYSSTKQRVDDLFFEYARLLKGLQPKVFVAENVSGLIKGVAKGYFKLILKELKACGYNVRAKVLNAQWLGVPQSRQRLIFIGVRNDLGLVPIYPKPLPYYYSVRDALPWVIKIRKGGQYGDYSYQEGRNVASDTIGTTSSIGNNKDNTAFVVEVESDISRYAIGTEWNNIKPGEISKKYLNLVKPHLDKPSPTVTQTGGAPSAASVVHPTEKRKFSIAELKRIMAFPDDFELIGTYSQQWERLGRAVPPVMMSYIAKTIEEEILRKI